MLNMLDSNASDALQKHFTAQEIYAWLHRPRSSLCQKSPYEILLKPTRDEINQINQVVYLIDTMLRDE